MAIIESFTQALQGDLGQKIKKDTIDRSYTYEDFQKWKNYFKEKGLFKEIAEKKMAEQNIPALCEFIYTLAQYFPSLSYYFLSKILFGILALKFSATEKQKEMYLDKLVEEDLFATFASKELEAGFELRRMQTVAIKEVDSWVINGGKEDVACTQESDLFLLLGKIKLSAQGNNQYGLFLLEKNMPGITVHYSKNKKSESSLRTGALTIENLVVGDAHFLGSLQNNHEVFNQVLDMWNLLLAAQLLGITRSVFDQGLNHALEINRFGQRFMDAPYIQQQFAQYKIELEVTENYFSFINLQTPPSTIQVTQLKFKAMEVSNEIIDGVLGIFGFATLPADHVLRNFKSISESVKNMGETPDFHLRKISKQWKK
ncbi:acyl-CoA dehydrogenase family protein [Carnobacterium pleistocenium]|uniref:acyl-CoA dehydrogenase family protein n=1 Tax=Carnobacterium pleistocenium TaxID=181073 RepID=UPI000A5A0768|nr:acyl-CoA dehydrogenase family protein [Carnobacterium pleistocenium]